MKHVKIEITMEEFKKRLAEGQPEGGGEQNDKESK